MYISLMSTDLNKVRGHICFFGRVHMMALKSCRELFLFGMPHNFLVFKTNHLTEILVNVCFVLLLFWLLNFACFE